MSAVISECNQYRYTLERRLADYGLRVEYRAGSYHPYPMPGPTFLFVGVNPSTADAAKDDSTSRKWIGFTEQWGGSGYYAVNPFAGRSKDVRGLAHMADPIGPKNDAYITLMAERADVIVPCWGNTTKVPRHLRYRFGDVLSLLRTTGKPIKVFGFTKSGDPIHPLMLAYATPLQDWKP